MDIPKPASVFPITVNGEKQEIKMTYGLFNAISQVIPNPGQITDLVITDPFLRDYVIRRVLTGNKHVERDEDLVDPFELDIDLEALDDLVSWVAEHILHFFMKSAAKTAAIGKKYETTVETLTQLGRSLTGSEN